MNWLGGSEVSGCCGVIGLRRGEIVIPIPNPKPPDFDPDDESDDATKTGSAILLDSPPMLV
jgi:hypothetical protein